MAASETSLDDKKVVEPGLDEETNTKDKKEVAVLDKVNALKLAARKADDDSLFIPSNIKADKNTKNNIPFYEVGKRFSFMEIAKATTMEDFKAIIKKATKVFDECEIMKKDVLPVKKSWFSENFNARGWVYTSSKDEMKAIFLDPDLIVKTSIGVRNALLGMNFTLTDLNGNADYQKLLEDAMMSMNIGITNYCNNLLSMTPYMLIEMKSRLKKAEYVMYESDDDKQHKKIAGEIGDEITAVNDHIKVMSELALKQTGSNFRALIEIVSKAGVLHGKEVANSYRKAMNTMLGNFEDTVKNMNSAFALKLAAQEKAANLRYDSMEARLTTEINRLEGVIKKSQELNKKYEASLSNLVGRMEKLNAVTDDDTANAELLKTRSSNLYASNKVLSADFKEVDASVKDREAARRGGLTNTNKIAIAATVLVLGTGGAYYLMKGESNGKSKRR